MVSVKGYRLGKGEVVSSILTGSTVKLGTSDKFHCNNRQETAGTYRETTLQSVENPWTEEAPMGLYDYVKCEVPLPDGWSGELQTKDFEDPYLELYVIRADGRLIHHKTRYDITPADEACGEVDANFHGVLNFYGGQREPGGHLDWHEYNAKFTDGKLVSIEAVPETEDV